MILWVCRFVSVGDLAVAGHEQPERSMVYRDDGDGKFADPDGFDLVSEGWWWVTASQLTRGDSLLVGKLEKTVGFCGHG